MRPPRREAALESIDVTNTDNIRQGFTQIETTISETHHPPTAHAAVEEMRLGQIRVGDA
jgi:hypothetical protein